MRPAAGPAPAAGTVACNAQGLGQTLDPKLHCALSTLADVKLPIPYPHY